MENQVIVFEDGVARDATQDEIAELEAVSLELKSADDLLKAKQEARTSALAKLAALGLTEEEIAAL
jgi:hypothetical protein